MMRIAPVLAVAAALIAGCDQSDHTIVAGGPNEHDPEAAAIEANGVELPPSITASKSYRCGDNSLIYVDWLSDGSARVKASKSDVGTAVPAGPDSPLKGDSAAAAISYNGKSCKA